MFVRWKKARLARGGERHFEHDEGTYSAGCSHPHGPDSVRLTPIVVESYRPEGKAPKHRTVWRPGLNIRQCCVNERETFDRLCFWARVEQGWATHAKTLAGQRERGEISAAAEQHFRNARETIFAQIGRVVPRWTQEERDLYRFCHVGFGYIHQPGESELERDRRIFRAAVARRDAWYAGRLAGESYAAWQDRARSAKSSGAQGQQQSQGPQPYAGNDSAVWLALEASGAPCWTVLGLKWPCTTKNVNDAYKPLAFKNHPDRGGKAEDFRRVTEAKNQALKFAARLEAISGRKAG